MSFEIKVSTKGTSFVPCHQEEYLEGKFGTSEMHRVCVGTIREAFPERSFKIY